VLYALIAVVIIVAVLVGGMASLFASRRDVKAPQRRAAHDSSPLEVPTGRRAPEEPPDQEGSEVVPDVFPDVFPDAGGTGGRPG
jgi:hypothetical protein